MGSGKAYIFGSGGHARVIASMIEREPIFVVLHDPGPGEMRQEEFEALLHRGIGGAPIYIGVGDNDARRRIFLLLRDRGARVANCIAPNVFVARDAILGEGVVLCPGSVVGSRARLGDNTIVNTLSSVDHHCILGDHSQVTVGVTLCGTVTVGSHCFFGVKSAVIPGISIGDNVTVMAGAVVVSDLPDNVVVGGTPARIMRHVPPIVSNDTT